jgi:hypothetical protein
MLPSGLYTQRELHARSMPVTVFPSDIPLIRLNWVAARASLREANSRLASSGIAARLAMLGEVADSKTTAAEVMLAMAGLRLQIRRTAALHG